MGMRQKTAEHGEKREPIPRLVALAGNPNVGKSTVFNALTGLHQHTGNWAGKTVNLANGSCTYKGETYLLTDLPGTYSLDTLSQEEQVAREALEQGMADCVVVLCDGACLERNLILVYQIMELTNRLVVCVNLMDEAERKGIQIDCRALSLGLGVPVVPAAAGKGAGLEDLMEEVRQMCSGFSRPRPILGPKDRQGRAEQAAALARQVTVRRAGKKDWQEVWDKILTGRRTGIPLMVLLLFGVLWLTIQGANVPSELLWRGVQWLYEALRAAAKGAGVPWFLWEPLLDGVLLTAGRVVSVMLPPMAIFFPLFTLLEDLGYLPRAAYTLDHVFQSCGGCGKQALTMCQRKSAAPDGQENSK